MHLYGYNKVGTLYLIFFNLSYMEQYNDNDVMIITRLFPKSCSSINNRVKWKYPQRRRTCITFNFVASTLDITF